MQSPGPLEAWASPPFSPEIRDGRIYARGAADDKGNVLPLLHVACALAREGALPVHVRILVEGEEEAGSDSVAEWVRADERLADCAIVFDSGMVDERTPAVTLGLRGMVMAQLEVRTAVRDLHSGIYGGSAAERAPRHARDAGRRACPVRTVACAMSCALGSRPPLTPSAPRGRGCPRVPTCSRRPARAPRTPARATTTTSATGPTPRSTSTRSMAGEPRTMVPAVARATFSQRLAPGQAPRRSRRRSSACCATRRRPART